MKAKGRTMSMHADEELDEVVLPVKRSNNEGLSSAETVEGRASPKGNGGQTAAARTLRRDTASNGLAAVRRAARQSKTVRFTALLHHITTDLLKQSYLAGGSGRLDTRLDTPPSIIRRHPDSPLSSERAQGYLKLPVGGTSLTLNVSDGSVAQEGAWPGSGGGEGEGIFFDRPSWHSSERPLLSNGSNSRSSNAYVIDVTDSGRQPCVPDDHRAGRSDGSLVSVPDGRRSPDSASDRREFHTAPPNCAVPAARSPSAILQPSGM